MFRIIRESDGIVTMSGRFDAYAADQARAVLAEISGTCRLDCSELDYIASVGLGILASQQKRLLGDGGELILAGLNPHLREVFSLAGFESVFHLE